MKVNTKKESAVIGNAKSFFTGHTIVVTGKLECFTRHSINAMIKSLGAIVRSTVSKNTDYLLCGDKAGSKLGKARAIGIPVLTEKQFLRMI